MMPLGGSWARDFAVDRPPDPGQIVTESNQDNDDRLSHRDAARQWLQMLSRAGIGYLEVGDPDTPVGQYFADQYGGQQIAAGSSDPQETSGHPSSSPSTSPAGTVKESAGPSPGKDRPTAARPAATGSGANPALKLSGDPVDDGPALATFADLPDPERATQLEILDQQVKQCTRCPELAAYRTRTVFGVGNRRPRLVMMGEAPGADEDRLGEPMVGLAGQLLDKIIAAMKLRREDVYILNTVKCRPPQNRNPTEQECGNCREYWRQQLEILKPECIVCLGAVASKTLLQTSSPVGRLRGQFHDYRGVPVAVTYHPAYLLRTESAKRQTWEDMKMVMERLGINI